MAGVLTHGVCYPDTTTANEAFCSKWSVVNGITEYRCDSVGTSSYVVASYVAGVRQAGTTVGDLPNFAPCDYFGGSVFALDWASAAMLVLVTIWSGKSLIGLFNRDSEKA